MSNKVLTRRELRQQKRQKTINYRNIKKGSAVVGTALVAVSVAAPLLNTNEVEAVEGKRQMLIRRLSLMRFQMKSNR